MSGPGFTQVPEMPAAPRRRRGDYMKMIGAESWDDVLDGGVYEITLPDNDGQLMDKFIKAARAVVFSKAQRSGHDLTLHIVKDQTFPSTRVTLKVLDEGA